MGRPSAARLYVTGLIVVAFTAFGCGGPSKTTGPTGGAGDGTLTLQLRDSPFSDAKAVLLTFSEVSAHLSGGSFVTLASGSRTCDLKKLVGGAQADLGTGPLPAGHYTQIRLLLASATLFFDNPSSGAACAASISPPAGASAPVEIPSGDIRLNREFDVTAKNVTTVTVDFDGDQSIKATGNGQFIMTPVVAVVSVQ